MKNKRISLVTGMTCPVCGAVDNFSVKTWWRMNCRNCATLFENGASNHMVDNAERFKYALCSDEEVLQDEGGYHLERRDVDFCHEVPLDDIYSNEGGEINAMPYYR